MPKPIPERLICDTCRLPWEGHRMNPEDHVTKDDCIRLLQAELASRPAQTWTINNTGTWSGTKPIIFKHEGGYGGGNGGWGGALPA